MKMRKTCLPRASVPFSAHSVVPVCRFSGVCPPVVYKVNVKFRRAESPKVDEPFIILFLSCLVQNYCNGTHLILLCSVR